MVLRSLRQVMIWPWLSNSEEIGKKSKSGIKKYYCEDKECMQLKRQIKNTH